MTARPASPWTRRSFVSAAAASAGATGLTGAQAAPAPFQPTWDSLVDGYRTPDWFRDAKFGIWEKAARKRGLRFGVSNHSAHAWHWYQPAYGYDPEGPYASQRYDAFHLTKADGQGKWWEGLDPQDLYTGRNMVMPDGFKTIRSVETWQQEQTAHWDEKPPLHNPAFTRSWFLRCRDLIDSCKPDLVYFDNTTLPLGQAGLDITAHYYNASMAWNGGKLEAVVNAKVMPTEWRSALVEDVERGFRENIEPLPWQTDTCLRDWHYGRGIFENHQYKPASTVIHRLCDIVSKNGNLLLSVPMRGDGSIDADERKVLEEIATWMARNGEAIYGTRPWRTYGEGPTKVSGGMFSEGTSKALTAEDIRFTTKGGALYAIALGWPRDGIMRIQTLADESAVAPGSIDSIVAVGSGDSLTFKRPGDQAARRPGRLASRGREDPRRRRRRPPSGS